MKKAFLIAFMTLLIGAAPATAHLLDRLPRDVSRKSARHTARVIHDIFSRSKKAHEAQKVVSCESGFRVRVKSSNGDYWGLFQMGPGARSTYGWGWERRAQTKAAHKYYLDEGWTPWSWCAP